ncbi:MAG: sigma-70 family RNA polymerase sigma factor [Verrucomicrobiae bacterium]|nr:sigma-70 family RNA polymerase sigma factor [Verrucomicrobiae bacterium]
MTSDCPVSTTDRQRFLTTRWSRVARACGTGEGARLALGELCEAYYAPVEAFLRRHAANPGEAPDLTQEFFARLLRGGGVAGANPDRGRFRSYLLGAVKHFLHDERVRRRAAKRGGDLVHVPLEAGPDSDTDTESGLQLPDPTSVAAGTEFDRRWANALLERALDRLEREMRAEGRSAQFEGLKPYLSGPEPPPPQAELAPRLGLGVVALKVAIHRLRRRFRDAVKAEIAETLADPAQVEEELRHLVRTLSS